MFFSKKNNKTVTFATTVWEKDWKQILLSKDYLQKKQIENHSHPFAERILIINNVSDYASVINAAEKKIEEGILSNYYIAKNYAKKIFSFFNLKREDFKKNHLFEGTDDWLYYNALAPLASIYFCRSDYLLYHTGDTYLKTPVSWIEKAIKYLEKRRKYKVANLTWNENFLEANHESYKETKDFYLSKRGFSDQLFLVKTKDFQKPIYQHLREDAFHFPRGDVFEKRVFCHMLKHGWKRITYKNGSYTHENF